MSKRSGMWGIRFSPSAALRRCKKAARRYWRLANRIGWSTDARADDPSEVPEAKSVDAPVQVEFCDDRMELNQFIETLRIGDRVRVLCDDGVLVAEKISRTQLRVIHSQAMPEWIQ